MRPILLALILVTLSVELLPSQIRLNTNPSTPMEGAAGVVVNDFNHDGKLDIARLLDGPVFTVELGLGNGVFKTGFQEPVSVLGPMLSGDFNQDGVLDVAIVGQQISVLLGKPDGTFQAERLTNISGFGGGAVGNLNGDKYPDLLIESSYYSGPVSFTALLGVGDGTFTVGPPGTFFNSTFYCPFVLADFDGDGRTDLVESGCEGLEVLKGNGDGSFGPGVTLSTGGGESVVAGDFNGDGHPDIVAVDNEKESTQIYLNNGDGSFGPPSLLPGILNNSHSLDVADANGDGKLDLLSGGGEDGGVSVTFGNGDGTFQSTITLLSSGGSEEDIGVGDFNADGIPDILVVGQEALCFLLGEGHERFYQPRVLFDDASLVPRALPGASADLNGDGLSDLVVFTPFGSFGQFASMKIALNVGGHFAIASESLLDTSIAYDYTHATKIADLNNDGHADIVYANVVNNGLYVSLNQGTSFRKATLAAAIPGLPTDLQLVDFDNDGKLDAAVLHFDSKDRAVVSVYPGNGDGSFGTPFTFPVSSGSSGYSALASADLNGDGKPDLAVLTGGSLSVFMNNGNGSFTERTVIPAGDATGLTAADLNQDGFGDLVLVGSSTSHFGFITVLLGHGDGTFSSTNYFAGVAPVSVIALDLNGDGYPEVISANSMSEDATVLQNDGDGNFTYSGSWFTGPLFGSDQPPLLVGSYDHPGQTSFLAGFVILHPVH